MKWSEQMRELLSEDEHYNQLIYDIDENALYINDKLIVLLNEDNTVHYETFCDLKKKYPYIDDKNFLLNCLFKFKDETTGYTSAPAAPIKICYEHPTTVAYGKGEGYSYIDILFIVNGDPVYRFRLGTTPI